MSGLLVICPIITPTYADACIESVLRPDSAFGINRDDILIVDNSRDGFAHKYGLRTYRDADGHNLGVARSWNVGAREVLEHNLDYLVILSSVMQFGPILHTTWRRQMEEFWGAKVIEAEIHSWHLISFHRTVFDKVGLFDENFHAYFEAIDFGYRMRMVGWEQGWIRVAINALSQGSALHTSVISCPAKPLLAYYQEKWGGEKGHETFVQPFGDQSLDYWPSSTIPELAERYGWTTWW